MIRVLQTLALALLVLGLAGRSAWAGKPQVVILGLEVIADKSGNIDQETVRVAKDFTTQLRARATAAGQLIPHSDKELVDEKLIRSCTGAEAACIAPIGVELGAAFLIYGSVEKAGGFKVSLHMLNVATKAMAKNFNVEIHDTSAIGLSVGAKSAYVGLLGGDVGSLMINVQNDGVDGGSVMVGKERHELKGGHLTVKDLGPDRYTLVVEVPNFQRYEQTVSLAPGEKKDVVVTLVPVATKVGPLKCGEGSIECGNTVSHTNNRAGYKVVGYSALLLSAVAGGIALYEWHEKIKPYEDTSVAPNAPPGSVPAGKSFGNDDCQTDLGTLIRHTPGDSNTKFDTACKARGTERVAGVISGVAAGVAIAALILAYRGSDEPEKHAQLGHRKHPKPLIAVTPIISPDGGGATLRIDF
jgi:hypothetical protein